jgi:hypothetical protein
MSCIRKEHQGRSEMDEVVQRIAEDTGLSIEEAQRTLSTVVAYMYEHTYPSEATTEAASADALAIAPSVPAPEINELLLVDLAA